MITWRDFEETAELAQQDVALLAEQNLWDEDFDRITLRQRVASTFVTLGMRIDPLAADRFAEREAAA